MKIIAANWKMNLTRAEGLTLTDDIIAGMKGVVGVKVILAVPFPFLAEVGQRIANVPNVHLAAQNCHHEESGAFTGEVSAKMLQSCGVEYVLIGHSERRVQYEEKEHLLLKKMEQALANGLCPIYCCGELKRYSKGRKHKLTVRKQIVTGPLRLSQDQLRNVIIAYEPVWAIGTGISATAEQAEDMHMEILQTLEERCPEVAAHIPLLYGGSVKPSNATELFSQPHIHGGLIGGASLVAEDFLTIVRA